MPSSDRNSHDPRDQRGRARMSRGARSSRSEARDARDARAVRSARERGNGGAPSRGTAPGKVRRRKMSKQKRAMYRRRRLAVLAGVLVVVAVCVFCVYSLIRGAVGMGDWIGAGERMSMSRSAAPAPKQESKVRDCSANDVELTLTPSTTAIGVGGSVEFTATIEYTGKDPEGCFVDGADDSRVLVVKSGDDTVYRSDACEDTYRPLLMMSGVKDEQKMTWNADRSGKECVADAQLPHVDRGTYTAYLELKEDPKVVSKPVTITVQ